MTTFDFGDGNGAVPAHQHPNGGGWVADSATVAESAFVGPDARVSGDARVYGDDVLTGHLGEHNWTIYRTATGWHVQYGCESHPLEWWEEQDLEALSVSHNKTPEHAKWTRYVVQQALAIKALHGDEK